MKVTSQIHYPCKSNSYFLTSHMGIPSIFKSRKTKTSCKWSPFKHIRTITFKAKLMFKTTNSFFSNAVKMVTMLDSSQSQSRCFSAVLEDSSGELIEMAVKALRTKRLSFEPEPRDTSFIMGATKFPFQDSVMQATKSNNPYTDFRNSMEEMIEAYGLEDFAKRDWEYLEELLAWYLRMNGKKNHRYIIEAFIDMYTELPSLCSFSYHASASSSKSKDWWEIEVECIPSCAEKGNCPKYC